MWGIPRRDETLHDLVLEIGRVVHDFVPGLRKSAEKGRGVEFLGHRPHQPSDTARDVDWMASARLSDDDMDLLTRVYAPERQFRVLVVADESFSMRKPYRKPRYAQALVRLFAESTKTLSDPVAVCGLGGNGMIYSGWLQNEEDLDVFLESADVPKQRRALRPSAATFSELLNEIGLKNLLIVFLTDLVSPERVPLEALRESDPEQNVQCVAVVLDEWSGFVPTSHTIVFQHPESGRIATLDLRKGGGVDREVRAFGERLRALRDQGKMLGLSVLTVPLADENPLRSFYKQWERYFEED
ncbi:MAG: DUF58 domain-containing protein [bacterium]|nr:DUF58 domain-containing protein [bacterium]